jgi:hypothetical protein
MRAWLSDCLQNHDNCKDHATDFAKSAPDRLVHIVSKSCVRLSTRHPLNTPYLALSYCWGVPNIFSTTNDNLREHLEGILVSKLPKTFRHALVITQALGYEYIWIDSMCIIQGDKEDFAHQSVQMGDIYSNADLVLSADLADNVHEGFLHERARASFAIEIPVSKCTQREHGQRPNETHSVCSEGMSRMEHQTPGGIKTIFVYPTHMMNDDGPQVSPTFERAWCFQEQRLARRLIHFTVASMYWSCRVHSRCECGTINGDSHMHKVQDFGIRGPLTNYANPEETSSMTSYQAMQHWSDVVQEFSRRKLTNPTDRLPAIAGLASRLQSSTLGGYHAGLWEHSLPTSLLWEAEFPIRMPEAYTPAYIGPTWSWVLSPTKISFTHHRLIDLAKIVQVCTHLESSEKYGPIRAAWIRINGLLLRLFSVREGRENRHVIGAYPRDRRKGSLSISVYLDLRGITLGSAPDTSSGLYLLMIAVERHLPFVPSSGNTFRGLILIKSCKQPGAFERVGTFKSRDQPSRKWKRKVVTII